MEARKGIIWALAIIIVITMINYNSFVRLDEKVNNSWAQVENQLKRRSDLVPNLVNTVKGYADHEKELFIEVAEARSKLNKATTLEEFAEANDELSSALNQVNIVVERYPELKADESFNNLQYELAGTENRTAIARRDYNDIVSTYNSKIRRFPGIFFARIMGFEKRDYFAIDEIDAALPEVNFKE